MVGSRSDKTSRLDAALLLDGVKANEIERNVLEKGEVVSRMSGTSAHPVVGEGDIHAPAQAILDGPMSAHRAGQSFGMGGQAADVEAALEGRLALDVTFRFDDGKGFQVEPLRRNR